MDRDETLDRTHALQSAVTGDEMSELQRENIALRQDNEDLRASAIWWEMLYEQAQQRCAALESSSKMRVSSHVERRMPLKSANRATSPRAGTDVPTRSL